MDQKYFPQPYEVIQIANEQFGLIENAEYGLKIWSAAIDNAKPVNGRSVYGAYCGIHAVFVAGYLAGRREQRAKDRKKKGKEKALREPDFSEGTNTLNHRQYSTKSLKIQAAIFFLS